MKLSEIATRIDVYLKRFELDPKHNPRPDPNSRPLSSVTRYYRAGSFVSGRYVTIVYVSYQGHSNLEKAEAERYLEWLDAGNVGKHHRANARSTFRRA